MEALKSAETNFCERVKRPKLVENIKSLSQSSQRYVSRVFNENSLEKKHKYEKRSLNKLTEWKERKS